LLAYVFWHRPRPGVDAARYENGLRALHAKLEVPSATFRLTQLPFAAAGGYEDWYLVEDWGSLGELNLAAVSGPRREPHDSVAALAGSGWGGVYALVRGDAAPPTSTRWIDRPDGEDAKRFLDSLPATTVWQRQLVLGPAPELCLVENGSPGRGREPI
jgi:hypothetical protein